MAGVGWLALILGAIIRYFGYEVAEEELALFAGSIIQFVGITLAFVGQVRRKDLVYGIFRK
jgi:hypothetical protein